MNEVIRFIIIQFVSSFIRHYHRNRLITCFHSIFIRSLLFPSSPPSSFQNQMINHEPLIDSSTIGDMPAESLPKYDNLEEAFYRGLEDCDWSEENKAALRGRDYANDIRKTSQVFIPRLVEVLGRIQYVFAFTSEIYAGEGEGVRVPGSQDGSYLCIYTSVNGVSTKVMTIQNTEDLIMEVFIYEPFPRMKLCLELSGRIQDHELMDIEVTGFVNGEFLEDITYTALEELLPFPSTPFEWQPSSSSVDFAMDVLRRDVNRMKELVAIKSAGGVLPPRPLGLEDPDFFVYQTYPDLFSTCGTCPGCGGCTGKLT